MEVHLCVINRLKSLQPIAISGPSEVSFRAPNLQIGQNHSQLQTDLGSV